MMRSLARAASVLLVLGLFVPVLLIHSPVTSAVAPATGPFERTWMRTDKPVLDGNVSRTWMWGPDAFSETMDEDYLESPGGKRTVQYFDKSRMEITDPHAVEDGIWYVTNGLLVVEMMTGRMQTGDTAFIDKTPAEVNVAGDADDPFGPTYQTFSALRDLPPLSVGTVITQTVDRAGDIGSVKSLDTFGVTAAHLEPATQHTVASVFWDFMNSEGLVFQDGQLTTDRVFVNPYYATGFPVTEAFWTYVRIGGEAQQVLVQAFERRVLTYTPSNPVGWQVEAGNVGQHYYSWRYGQAGVPEGPSALATALANKVVRAGDDESRYQALLEVMDHLNVGVYSGDGQAILSGAERGAADFYLYDIELHMMAAAIGRGQTWGVVDLAMQLTTMELLPEGETFDPEVLRQAIHRAVVASAATPGEFSSLPPLLVRQLGLLQPQPYDLLDDLPLDAIRFDPLAYFLLLADITIPMMAHDLPLAGGGSNLLSMSNGVLQPVPLSNPCDLSGFHGDAAKDGWAWGKTFAEVLNFVPKAVAKATVILDGIHGAVLAYSVHVKELDQRLDTHYGHDGPGKELHFRVKVEMLDDLGDVVLKCGWIIGAGYPAKGPIPGVSVHWFFEKLDEHGEIYCGNACVKAGPTGLAIEATNAEGIATMTFRPKQEENPGEGRIVSETGIVTGIALYQSAFTNLLGSYMQYLTPKSGATRWEVSWHETPGWDVVMKLNYDVYITDGYTRVSASGNIIYTLQIDADKLGDFGNFQYGGEAPFQGSGSGVYHAHEDCSGSWTGIWARSTAVEIVNRDQLIAKVIGYLGPGANDTSHSWTSTTCNAAADYGISIIQTFTTAYPSFSLKQHSKQTKPVATESIWPGLKGKVTWEITVTPR